MESSEAQPMLPAKAGPMNPATRAPAGLAETGGPERTRFLTFGLGSETFAMDIRNVKEVIQHTSLTEVPLVPTTIRGVINLRGAVVPVVDLAVRLGWSPTEINRRTCTVILELEQEGTLSLLGILVDQVREVLDIGSSEIESAPAFGSSLRPDFIRGIAKVGGRFLTLLETERILAIDELSNFSNS